MTGPAATVDVTATVDDAAPEIGRPALPPGRAVHLPGRGTTFVREIEGPADAPTVMLLHGWTVTAAVNWYQQFDRVGDHARVIAPDHRGHGRGIRTRRPFSLEDAADDAVALADELGVDRFAVAGYSMGGPIAQLIAHRHPHRITGMVLAATFARQARTRRERSLMTSIGTLGRGTRALSRRRQLDLLARASDAFTSAPERPPWILAEVRSGSVPMMLEAASAIGRFDSTPWVGSVDVPTGVLVTSRDEIVGPHLQHHLAASIPHAEVRNVPVDHDGCVTRPREFNDAFVDLVEHALGP